MRLEGRLTRLRRILNMASEISAHLKLDNVLGDAGLPLKTVKDSRLKHKRIEARKETVTESLKLVTKL